MEFSGVCWKSWQGYGLLILLLILVSYSWLDIPLVYVAYGHGLRKVRAFYWATKLPELMRWTMHAALVLVIIARLCGPLRKRWLRLLAAMSLSTILAGYITLLLKLIFGRVWPETWVHDNISLLHGGAYGFRWFKGGDMAYRSFPSGHMTTTLACLMPVWVAFRKWRGLVVLLVALVAIGLMGMYFHFLSDILAGALVGGLTGYVLASCFRLGDAAENTPKA